MTKLKGLTILQCREHILARYGEAALSRIKAAMSPAALASIYADDLLSTDWIEVTHGLEHLEAFDRVLGKGDGRTGELMIREITAQHFNGVYRATLATAATPVNVLERSSRVWSRIYDRGESCIEVHSPTSVTKLILDCPDLPLRHEALTMPYYEELVRQCGGRDVVCEHVECVARGATRCATKVRWK
jgi:hypothetical protein